MSGRLQNQDFKSEAELIAAGASASSLLNDSKIYVTANSLNKTLDDAIIDGDIGGSGTGKNYVENPSFKTGTTAGWGLFNTTLTNKIPTGSITAGAASITSFAVDSTTPIEGTYDLRVGSSGAITAGHGFISDAFTIDREDYAKVLGFSFAYESVSGTMDFSGTSANTWAVYIYDVDGAAWIQPAGVYNLVQGSGVGIASGTFQTTANGTQYRIAVVCITATSGAVEMRFDDFQLGPSITVQGAAVTDWVSYTPTTSKFTASAIEGKWRRVGDSVEVKVRAVMSAVDTLSPGAYSISAPFVADTAKFPASLPNNFYGTGGYYDLSANQGYIGTSFVTTGSSPVIGVYGPAGSQWQVSTVPVAFGAGDILTMDITYPVQGWSSNTVLSQDTDTRVVAARAFVNSPQTVASGAIDVIVFDGTTFDTHGGMEGSGATRGYRVKVSGKYRVSSGLFSLTFGPINWSGIQIWRNGSEYSRIESAAGSSRKSILITDELDCVAGDLIQVKLDNASGAAIVLQNGQSSYLTVERASGPATIAASENVKAFYRHPGGQNIVSSDATQVVNFSTKVYDSHNAVTTGAAWKFTAPVSGTYRVAAETLADPAAGWVAGEEWTNRMYIQDGSIHSILGGQFMQAGHSTLVNASGSTSIYMNAGEWLQLRIYQSNGSTVAVRNDPAFNFIVIEKVGY